MNIIYERSFISSTAELYFFWFFGKVV